MLEQNQGHYVLSSFIQGRRSLSTPAHEHRVRRGPRLWVASARVVWLRDAPSLVLLYHRQQRMNLHAVLIIFQIVVLLFAISLHEAAHGWMAWRLGDPTARMLGRVTLNPIKHIDPFGTILIPLLCVYAGFPLIGWAKPTPVTTRNFKHIKRDDILTTLAGPASNLLTAIVALSFSWS